MVRACGSLELLIAAISFGPHQAGVVRGIRCCRRRDSLREARTLDVPHGQIRGAIDSPRFVDRTNPWVIMTVSLVSELAAQILMFIPDKKIHSNHVLMYLI